MTVAWHAEAIRLYQPPFGWTAQRIGDEFGKTRERVRQVLEAAGVRRRASGESRSQPVDVACQACGKVNHFEQKKLVRLTCGGDCLEARRIAVGRSNPPPHQDEWLKQRQPIVAALCAQGPVTLEELAAATGASRATVSGDVTMLGLAGVRRVKRRGGRRRDPIKEAMVRALVARGKTYRKIIAALGVSRRSIYLYTHLRSPS